LNTLGPEQLVHRSRGTHYTGDTMLRHLSWLLLASALVASSGCSETTTAPTTEPTAVAPKDTSEPAASDASSEDGTLAPQDTQSLDESTNTVDVGSFSGTFYNECVLTEPTGDVPDDLYVAGDVEATSSYGKFSKTLHVYGITLVAKADVPDAFLRAVRDTVVEMFPPTATDLTLQGEILRNMHAYKATIPVFSGGEAGFDESAIQSMDGNYSLCDIIMEGTDGGQTMEVLEHILHHVTNVGLHYTYPGLWGLTSASTLHAAYEETTAAGIYNVKDYEEIDELAVRRRVELQELAYWLITSYWDVQAGYGSPGNEWKARSPDTLQSQSPTGFTLVQTTIGATMGAPSKASLDAFSKWQK
jgi:hypothetical protein